ncbi:MAG: hypothetical protein BV456_11580 [Thermoplasmata archaeon M8B2D]|nr:MAG: hypothetical protein BV456_11580 [Thermoplasmata archaeon M8B2D]
MIKEAPYFEDAHGHTIDSSFDDPEREFQRKELAERVREALNTLSPRQAQTLRLLFGMGGEKTHTYKEVAKIFGITPSGVNALRMRALGNLKYKSELLQQIVSYDFWRDMKGIYSDAAYQ